MRIDETRVDLDRTLNAARLAVYQDVPAPSRDTELHPYVPRLSVGYALSRSHNDEV